ncbi:hypothetical protein GmRootV59_26310 [Variovorax sp. V59]
MRWPSAGSAGSAGFAARHWAQLRFGGAGVPCLDYIAIENEFAITEKTFAPQERDRRSLNIRLTRKGKQMARKAFDQHGRWIASLFLHLSVQERKTLAGLLQKVAARRP